MSDLIDREQAKDAIDKYLVGRNLVTDGTFMARLINEIVIDRLPSAQPEISMEQIKIWLDAWEGYVDKDIIARMKYRVIDIPFVQTREETT